MGGNGLDDYPNGLREKVSQAERRLDGLERDFKEFRRDFPNREGCRAHSRSIGELFERLHEIETTRVPPEEWHDMKKDVLALKLRGVYVGVVISLVVVLASAATVHFLKIAIDQAFAKETKQEIVREKAVEDARERAQ
jgi:hypothetical protein